MPPAATSPAPRSVVVVGAGLAAAHTVSALREQGFDGTVTVLGAEGVEPYDRPPLSKELLDRTVPAWVREETGADVATADVVRLADPATGLRLLDDGVLVTTSGDEVRADAAVLATGAHAVRVPGWDTALTLHTHEDAGRLRPLLRPGARLVVVGAGWIGAEVAGVAAAAGVEVTVVEAAAAPLAAALGPEVGDRTRAWYGTAGIRLLTSTPVATVRPGRVELADDRVLEADVVLAAVGARPTSAWLDGSLPLAPDGSVRVDEHHRVLLDEGALDRVVAVGDLAARRSPRYGWVPGGHWDAALHGPATAVRTLLTGGTQPAPDPAPYVFSTQLGHELGLHGLPRAGDEVVLRGDAAGWTAVWFAPGTPEVTAVLAVDRPRDVAAARRLLSGPALPRLDRERVADAGRPLKAAVL